MSGQDLLKEHDISKGLLAKIKFEGGHIWVNGEEQFATYPVHEGDVVTIEIPDEAPHETLKPIPLTWISSMKMITSGR